MPKENRCNNTKNCIVYYAPERCTEKTVLDTIINTIVDVPTLNAAKHIHEELSKLVEIADPNETLELSKKLVDRLYNLNTFSDSAITSIFNAFVNDKRTR